MTLKDSATVRFVVEQRSQTACMMKDSFSTFFIGVEVDSSA